MGGASGGRTSSSITGDLLTHPRGEPLLRALVERLPLPTFAVLGNHDIAISRDPQARRVEPARARAGDAAARRGRAARAARPAGLDRRDDPRLIVRGTPTARSELALAATPTSAILLCHYPRVLDRLEPGRFDLVLAGHMHDGQIASRIPGGKIRLAHPTRALRARGLPQRGRR